MGPSLKGTESAGGVGRIPTQTSNTTVDTMAAATAPGTRRLGLEQKLSVALSKGGLGQACTTTARQDRCTGPAGSCASCNHWERVGNASVGLSSCQRAASEEAPQALD